MQNTEKSLAEAENKAFTFLKEELSEHYSLSEKVWILMIKVANQLPEMYLNDMRSSLKVALSLITRISNDLRCVAQTALYGYPVQAVSLTASIYEAAYTIAYIGSDEKLAQDWIKHEDPTRLFKDIRTITKTGLENLGVPDVDGQSDIEYRNYRQFCWAKHSNPLFIKQHGISRSENTIFFNNGPDTSEQAVIGAWFALEHASALSLIAIASFIINHVPKERQPEVIKEYDELGKKRKNLESRAKERWGTKNPFPGRW